MVGGLVMGALEKLYRQPALFTYSLLVTCELCPSPAKKAKKKRSPTHVTVSIRRLRLQYMAL
jgi:hypothetical protein